MTTIPRILPTAEAQHRPLPLVVTPGPNGYRLVFAGGTVFDVIAEYPTFGEAWKAQKLLVGLTNCFSGKVA